MAAHGARRLMRMTANLFHILGIELFCAAEGIRFRAPLKTSAPLCAVLDVFNADIRPLLQDRYLAPDLEASARLVRGRAILDAAGVTPSDLESV
jgi:histidine ammonia-lyase